MLSILTVSIKLTNSTLWWMVFGANWVRCVRGAAGQCFGSVIVPPVHFGTLFHYENTLIGYADDSTSMAVVPSPGVGVRVAVSDP